MHKDELLQLHSLLCQMKRFFEDTDLPFGPEFEEYDDLQVSPQHIHKSKTDHKRAVFLLGKGLTEVVLTGNDEHRARLRDRFLRLAAVAPPPEHEAEEPEQDTRTEHLPAFAVQALSQGAA